MCTFTGGKYSTLLLQCMKETFQNIDKFLYVSLDNLWFNRIAFLKEI